MPSEVEVVSYNGAAPGTPNVITSDRYNTSDQIDPGLAYANQVPEAGQTNRSYWKQRGLHIKGGSFSQLSNFRWGGPSNVKTAWGLGSKGGMIQVALTDSDDPGCPVGNYCRATGVQGEYGHDIKDGDYGHDYYKGESVPCADMDNYYSASPLVFDSSVKTAIGYTKLVTTQLILKDDTTFGEKAIIYEFWRWQEI